MHSPACGNVGSYGNKCHVEGHDDQCVVRVGAPG